MPIHPTNHIEIRNNEPRISFAPTTLVENDTFHNTIGNSYDGRKNVKTSIDSRFKVSIGTAPIVDSVRNHQESIKRLQAMAQL